MRVFDPTEAGGQPRGKQTTNPGGIMYTPTTGIWQTVWLEPVAPVSVQDVDIVPDVDNQLVRVTANVAGATDSTRVAVKIMDGTTAVKTVAVMANVETAIPVANPKLWSPDSPFLYNVSFAVMNGKKTTDTVNSYFGMRKISIGMSGGVPQMLLNNKFVFEIGPLDQGFWPDGIYTAPTDDALKSDIEMEKNFGFSAAQIAQLVVCNIHDDDLDVWINGVLAYRGAGAVHTYENKTISEEAQRSIVANAPNLLAVHCHEAGGDQNVDIGLSLRIPAPGRQ